jgi:hypothetical protein
MALVGSATDEIAGSELFGPAERARASTSSRAIVARAPFRVCMRARSSGVAAEPP